VLVAVYIALLLSALPAPAEGQGWLEQAQMALERGQFANARLAANKALAAAPDSSDAEVILGLADTGEGNLSAATQHFTRAVSIQPGNYRAHAYLGSTFIRENRLVEARKSFDKVLTLSPGNQVAHYNLGVISMLERNPSAALAHFAAVIKTNPSDAAALIGLLECQVDLRQASAVGESARKLDKLLLADSPALLQVGSILAAQGYSSTGLPMLRRFAASNPQSFDARYNLALALLHTGSLDEAAGELQAVVRSLPKPEAYNLLGEVEEKRGRRQDALRAFEQAVRLAPTDEEFRIDYGSALVNADNLTGAMLVFTGAIDQWPDSLRPRLGLASVYYLAGKHEQCAKTLLEGIARLPNAAPLYDLLGKTFEAVPDLQREIKAIFETYIASGTHDAMAHAHLGTMLYLTADGEGSDRFAQAKEQLRRALVLNPRLPQAHLQLGIIAQEEGDLQQALRSYQRTVTLAPMLTAARYRLGSVYGKLGNRTRAQAELEIFRNLKASDARQERESTMRSVAAARKK
jgi:tetratricopeptide (TPR) repeat protein